MKHSTYTPNVSARKTTCHQRKSSPGNTGPDVQTITLDDATGAVLLTAETTNVRCTLDGSDPSAASAPSFVVIKDQNPILLPVGQKNVIKFCSTAVAAGVLQVAELR